jgi:spore maturation protein CgeB
LRRTVSQVKRRVLGRPMHPPRLPRAACWDKLSDEDMVTTFSRSRVNLGFSTVGDTARTRHPIRQVRLRDFEVPMSGGFYMLEYVEEIEQFFVPGEEIVCFAGEADLVEKCRYYLDHETERRRIAQSGRRRALKDHTWQKRLSDAFREMGLDQA